MHAIQDASVPHHATGYMGNWHSEYESDLDANVVSYLSDPAFDGEVKKLFEQWCHPDQSPPNHLNVNDWKKKPSINWRIDQLVTWVALNAYKEYDTTYQQFRYGYQFNSASAKKLVKIAVAMCLLVFTKATDRVNLSSELMALTLD
jgi:hypothetical protein